MSQQMTNTAKDSELLVSWNLSDEDVTKLYNDTKHIANDIDRIVLTRHLVAHLKEYRGEVFESFRLYDEAPDLMQEIQFIGFWQSR